MSSLESARPEAGTLLVDLREAARLLCVSPRTVWTLKDRGELPVVYIGRSVRFRVTDLEAFVAARAGREGGAR